MQSKSAWRRSNFSPDVLGMTATSSFFIVLFLVTLVKFGASIICAAETKFLELTAYVGYVFIPYFYLS